MDEIKVGKTSIEKDTDRIITEAKKLIIPNSSQKSISQKEKE